MAEKLKDTGQFPVTVKDPSGKTVRVLIPVQQENEDDATFEHRKEQAKAMASEFTIGAEIVAATQEKFPQITDMEGLLTESIMDIQSNLESEEAFAETLKRLPRSARNESIFQQNALQLMKLRAQQSALRKFAFAQPNSVDFDDLDGTTGKAFNIDTRGRVEALTPPDSSIQT
jgi:hypothetical protein